jgi:hypothetical protein
MILYPIIRILHLPWDHRLTSQMECHWAGVEGILMGRLQKEMLYISTQQSAIGEERSLWKHLYLINTFNKYSDG